MTARRYAFVPSSSFRIVVLRGHKVACHHERIARRMSPAGEDLNDIEGAANAYSNVRKVLARSRNKIPEDYGLPALDGLTPTEAAARPKEDRVAYVPMNDPTAIPNKNAKQTAAQNLALPM